VLRGIIVLLRIGRVSHHGRIHCLLLPTQLTAIVTIIRPIWVWWHAILEIILVLVLVIASCRSLWLKSSRSGPQS